MAITPGQLRNDLSRISLPNHSDPSQNEETLRMLHENRRLAKAMGRGMGRSGSTQKYTSGGDTVAAIPRFFDPFEPWDLSGLPWNMADEGHRHKLHKWMRLFYATHYLVPALVDIYTRFPLAEMRLESKDQKITEFYEDVFLGTLKYDEFLTHVGREYWTVGEAFPIGYWNEILGVWESERLINPEDTVIENFPFLGQKQIKVVPPEHLKRLVQNRMPAAEYKQLEIGMPELIPYLKRGEPFPVSDVLLKQVQFAVNPWDDHGTPILLRGLRTLMHEEKLMASQDAIAERLYSPLILAKLGVMDMGDGMPPWVPGPAELDDFRDELDFALASDFRLMVYNFGVEIENVFGREQMPDLWNDFDRVERRLMQVFGMNPSLLSAGSNSQPYASSALQAEFMNQMLRTFQGYLKDHYKERAAVVAEAQEHWDYEKKGNTRIPLWEEHEVINDDGSISIEKKRKLLIPELEMATLDMRDEATERQYLQQLRAQGLPIADRDLMVGTSFKFEDTLDRMQQEMKWKTVAQQRAKLETFEECINQGIPPPPDLAAEIAAMGNIAAPGGAGGMAGGPGEAPGMDTGPSAGPGGAQILPPAPPDIGMAGGGGGPPVTGPEVGGGNSPSISDERRGDLVYNTKTEGGEEYGLIELPRAKRVVHVPLIKE